jgi:hypothetical protein
LPHRSPGSSSQFGQSGFLSHTFSREMHIPPPHSNCVLGSHLGAGDAVTEGAHRYTLSARYEVSTSEAGIGRYSLQFSSSLWSLHSAWPEQCRCPGMHALFLHWNWSGRHVTFWHRATLSSLPPGQSLSPSQTQDWWMHVMRSSHSNSRERQ